MRGVHLTKGQPDPKADQMSSWPHIVPFLATRCSTRVTSELQSTRPKLVPILATRCFYQGVHLTKGQPTQRLTKCQANLMQYHSRPPDAPIGESELRSTGPSLVPSWPLDASTRGYIWPKVSLPKGWPNVKLTWSSTILHHHMPLLGVGTSDKRSVWPKNLKKCQSDPKPHLWGSIWFKCKRTSEHLNTLCISCFASQRSFLRKTN